jgi:uncharacterized protein (TIGR00661 family)
MRILYSVAGEGFGHYSRSKEIIDFLRKRGHKVLVVTYGQAYPLLKRQFPTIKIEGFPLIFKNEKLSIIRTAIAGAKAISINLRNFNKLKSKIKKFSPDVCITDFEPFVKLFSLYFRIPLISIDNQHILTKTKTPHIGRGAFIAKLATRLNPIRADYYIILSLEKIPNRKNVFFVSPVARSKVLRLKTSNSGSIVVYENKENITKILRALPHKFIVYNNDKVGTEDNITYKKISDSFIYDMAKARAVIASAGFSLLSEAVYLKKPFFATPQQGQFEQEFNASLIRKLGIGDYSDKPTKEQIERFIGNLSKYENNLRKQKLNPKEALFALEKILKSLRT